VTRAVVIIVLLVFGAFATAADPGPGRLRARVPMQADEPDIDDEGENAEPDAPDEDDGFDDGRAAPLPRRPGPTFAPPREPSTPRDDEEEEPAAPPEHAPVAPGPAEPASAMQPVSPE
jgi:hypothetical protein